MKKVRERKENANRELQSSRNWRRDGQGFSNKDIESLPSNQKILVPVQSIGAVNLIKFFHEEDSHTPDTTITFIKLNGNTSTSGLLAVFIYTYIIIFSIMMRDLHHSYIVCSSINLHLNSKFEVQHLPRFENSMGQVHTICCSI